MEQSIAAERRAALASLPGDFGYSDLNDFIKALKEAQGAPKARRGRPPKSAKASAPAPAPAEKTGRRPRAKITEQTKNDVKALVEAGQTGLEIAKALKISLPSVQNIKKALGLVKARSNSA